MKGKKLLLLLVSLTLSGLTSCGEKESDYDADGKIIVRMFINSGNNFEGRKKDNIWLKLEEKTGVSLRIEGATHNSDYYTTLNPMINTGDIPDVIFAVPSDAPTAYANWVNQEIIWNIDELLAEKPGEYPHVEAILQSNQFKNVTYGNGAHTLLPLLTSNSGWGIYYRTDWLINVGYCDEIDGKKVARTPKTIEEFQEVLKLFTENDPDGNGKNDTYGMSPYGETFYLNPLYHAFGVTPNYDLDENNKATYMYMTDEFKDFLSWFNQMYENGYIDPQFATNKNNADRDKFYEGKTGILITNAESHVKWIADAVESRHGKDKLTFGDAPFGTKNLGKEGAHGFSDWGGWWGGYSISTDCKDPHAVLRFFDFLYSEEGSKLIHYGIEGTHYDMVDGKVVPNIANRNEEPTKTFNTMKDENGAAIPSGYYEFGSLLCSNVSWDDNMNFKVLLEPDLIDGNYADLIALGIEKNEVISSRLTNVTGFYDSFNTKMKKITDETNTFAINAIMGNKNLTSDYDKLLETLSTRSYDWPNVAKMIEEVAKNGGIF